MSFNMFDNDQRDTENMINMAGTLVTVNGVTRKVLITNPSLVNLKPDTRYLTATDTIHSGDKVVVNGKNWLVTSDIGDERAGRNKTMIRYTPHRLQFVKGYFDFATVYVYSDVQSLGIDTNQFLTWVSGKLNLICSYDTAAKRILVGDRFIKWGNAWKVTGLDYQTVEGVLIVKASSDTFNQYDYKEAELANFYPTHPAGSGFYEITTTEPAGNAFMWAGDSHTMLYQVKHMGIVTTEVPVFTVPDDITKYIPVTHGSINTSGVFTSATPDNWTVTVQAAIGDTSRQWFFKTRMPLNAAIRAVGNSNPFNKITAQTDYEVWYTDAAGVETKSTGGTWTLNLNGHVAGDVTSVTVSGGGWRLTPNVANGTVPVYLTHTVTLGGTVFNLSLTVYLNKGGVVTTW